MASWGDQLIKQWEEEDRRAAASTTQCCGRRDFTVIYVENGRALVRCRQCLVDSKIKV